MLILASVCSLLLALPLAPAPLIPIQGGVGGSGKDDPPPPPPPPPGDKPPGGTWGGPGDQVPGGGSSITPVSPGGSVPGAAGDAPRAGPGTAAPGSPAGPGTSGFPASGRLPMPAVTALQPPDSADPTAWTQWWTHNQAPFLALRDHVHRPGTLTGSDDFFLGDGEQGTASNELVPDRGRIEAQILPALTSALREEHAHVLRVAATVALARAGTSDPDQGAEIVSLLLALISAANQDVVESAVVALGVLGEPAAVESLFALLGDEEPGRELCGSRSVPERLRAFAAYALALLGTDARSDLRAGMVGRFMDMCERDDFATADVEVALYGAIGLLPIDERTSTASIRRAAHAETFDRRILSRRAQLAWLVGRMHQEAGKGRAAIVRAQIPIAIGRLGHATSPALRESLALVLLDALDAPRDEPAEVRAGIALALGELGDCDADGVDEAIRDALVNEARTGDATSRRFALVSLGWIAGRVGDGAEPHAGAAMARDFLLEVLAKGHSQLEPWAGIGLGLAAHARRESGAAADPMHVLPLRQAASECRRPQELGAYAIALGLARDYDAAPLLLERLGAIEEIEARSPIALALGLIGDRGATEVLRTLLEPAHAQPAFFVDVSISLALLGDKQVVPVLLEILREAGSQATQIAACQALSRVGDARAVEPLLELLSSQVESTSTRAAAAGALGGICDRRALPWETPLSVGANYVGSAPTLTDGRRGVLDYE